jgi:hypothetical protein
VTTEENAMALLREANPVRDVSAPEPPKVVLASILSEGRSSPARRMAVASAAASIAVAAILLVVFGFTQKGPHARADARGSKSNARTGKVAGPAFSVPQKQIALSDASAALGAPVVLPTSSLVKPSEAGAVTEECPPSSGNSSLTSCTITVNFPAQSVTLRYSRHTYADPLAVYQGDVSSSTDGAQVVYLSGVPALVIPQDPNDPVGTATYIEFIARGTTIAITGHYDASTLESVAESIISQAGGAGS